MPMVRPNSQPPGNALVHLSCPRQFPPKSINQPLRQHIVPTYQMVRQETQYLFLHGLRYHPRVEKHNEVQPKAIHLRAVRLLQIE